jgi:hypothetical protein
MQYQKELDALRLQMQSLQQRMIAEVKARSVSQLLPAPLKPPLPLILPLPIAPFTNDVRVKSSLDSSVVLIQTHMLASSFNPNTTAVVFPITRAQAAAGDGSPDAPAPAAAPAVGGTALPFMTPRGDTNDSPMSEEDIIRAYDALMMSRTAQTLSRILGTDKRFNN